MEVLKNWAKAGILLAIIPPVMIASICVGVACQIFGVEIKKKNK